jgi:hypothetical protein
MQSIFFSPDFSTAQQRFRSAALTLGVRIHALPLGINAPNGDQLSIDIAWLGSPQPRRALIHVSGIHGVEGFAGSAVQLALLDQPPALPADCALILVHVLNPYGMACLRRVNEHNVDLNRNFFIDTAGWQGAPDGYAKIDRLLNPPCPPSRIDSYYGRLLVAWAHLGKGIINQAVASGQYCFPKGIFYGGIRLEAGPQLYCDWLAGHLREVQELFVVDVHCGIGAYGQQNLFLSTSAVNAGDLSRTLQVPVANRDQASHIMGYTHQGCHSGIYQQLLPDTRAVCLTQEFGTYNGIRLLHALRAENQHHHYGDGRLEHWSKRELKRKFCPEDAAWCSRVVSNGCDLVRRALMLFDGTGSVALS